MEKMIERYGDYASISGRVLERMKKFASEGDFDSAFSRAVDLISEDDDKFYEFLEEPQIQEKMAERIKSISEEVQSQKMVSNTSDIPYEMSRILHFIKQETIGKFNIQSDIDILKEFIKDQD